MNPALLPIFDVVTVLMLVLTLGMVGLRLSDNVLSNIPLGYTMVLMFYYRGFPGTLDTWPMFLYLFCVVFLRVDVLSGLAQKTLRFAEFALLGYVTWRLVGLLLGWPGL
jgi:hypothetical protein